MLCDGLIPVQGVLPTVYGIKKLKKRLRPNKRAVDLITIMMMIIIPPLSHAIEFQSRSG
jgi:hypothetical protein